VTPELLVAVKAALTALTPREASIPDGASEELKRPMLPEVDLPHERPLPSSVSVALPRLIATVGASRMAVASAGITSHRIQAQPAARRQGQDQPQYPAASSRFLVHDGTDITCTPAGGVEIKITSLRPQPVRLSILAPPPVAGVLRDGTTLPQQADPNAFANETPAWRHDPSSGFLEIKFPLAGTTTVSF